MYPGNKRHETNTISRDRSDKLADDRRATPAFNSRDDRRTFQLNLLRTKPMKIMNQEITNLLKAYEKALNTSDAKAALALYGSDPIVMPQSMPAFIGREAVQATYEGFFKVLKLNVVFTIHEIVDMGGDWRTAAPLRPENRRSSQVIRCRKKRTTNCSSSARNRESGKFTATSLPPQIHPHPNNGCTPRSRPGDHWTNSMSGNSHGVELRLLFRIPKQAIRPSSIRAVARAIKTFSEGDGFCHRLAHQGCLLQQLLLSRVRVEWFTLLDTNRL